MITTRLSQTVTAETHPPEASVALPGFRRLAGAACLWGALPIALLLLAGKLWLAISVALGVGISLGVCGLLFLFVERIAPLFFGAGRVHASSASSGGAQFQFLLLLGAKLMFIALLGAAFLTLHHVNSIAVLVGFMLAQTAIVLSALRFRKLK